MRFPGEAEGKITSFNGFKARSSKCNLTPIDCSNWGTRGGIFSAIHWCKILCFMIGSIFSCYKQTAPKPNPNPNLFCDNWRSPWTRKVLLSKQRTPYLPHGLYMLETPRPVNFRCGNVSLLFYVQTVCCENNTEYPSWITPLPNCTNPHSVWQHSPHQSITTTHRPHNVPPLSCKD